MSSRRNEMLETQCLKLNKNYQPVEIISVKEAFVKLYSGVAEVISVEDGTFCNYDFNSWAQVSDERKLREAEHDWVYTPHLSLVVPRVIRVLTYDRVNESGIKLTRRNIYARDENTCQYCGKKKKTHELNIDHVIPRSKGGRNTWKNLVCSCIKCNQRKANRTPKESGMKLIRVPYKPDHSPQILMHVGRGTYSSWKHFVSEVYWTRELED